MTKKNKTTRRSVLEGVGCAGIAGIFTSSIASAAKESKYMLRLSEYGIQYNLKNIEKIDGDMKTTAVDVPTGYSIDDDSIILNKMYKNDEVGREDTLDRVIQSQTLQTPGNSETPSEIRCIPVQLNKRKQPMEVIHLSRSILPLRPEVQYNDQLLSVQFPQLKDQNIIAVDPGEERTIEMREELVEIIFGKLSDQLLEIPNASEHQRPLKKLTKTEEVRAIPQLKIKNHGVMKVKDPQNVMDEN